MIKDLIEKILIIWDPYGTIGYGPMDEYSIIRDEILSILNQADFSVVKLTKYLELIDVSNGTTKEKIYALSSLIIELNNRID